MRSLLSNLINNVRFYKSLKFRIFIIVLIIGIIPAVVMRRLIVNSYESRALSQKTAEVTNQTAIVAAHLKVPNSTYKIGRASCRERV